MNTDDFIEKMKRDELEDAPKLTPREFSRIVDTSPQLVYYHIRQGHIKTERCQCGRTVIDVAEARTFFEGLQAKEKVSGIDVDS